MGDRADDAKAASYSAQLPQPVQGPFVAGFSQAAKGGLEIGRGQTGTNVALPAGVPAQIAQQIQQVAHAVFTQAFVDAMRPTMALAIAVILVAAIGSVAIRSRRASASLAAASEVETPASVA